VTEVRVDDKKTGSYHISYFPRVQGRYKFSIKVNGEHVRGSPFTVVVVKPFQFKPVLTCGKKGSANGMFQSPHGVAVRQGCALRKIRVSGLRAPALLEHSPAGMK